MRVVAITSLALVLAVKAIVVFLLTYNGDQPFLFARSIVIIDYYISSSFLIAMTAIAPRYWQSTGAPAKVPTQAFFYACFASGLYFIIASLMLISFCGSKLGYHKTEYILVANHKALVYQAIGFKIYLLTGAAIFAQVEEWSYLDAVFWADSTILTIGLGDFSPQSHLGRSLLFPYAVGGVILLGTVIASIQSFFSPRQERKIRTLKRKEAKLVLRRIGSE